MITGLSKKRQLHIAKEDRDSPDPTRFYYRNLDRLEIRELKKTQPKPQGDEITIEMMEPYLNMGVLDWENFPDPEGEMIPFSVENIRFIPFSVALELFLKIIGAVSEEERKNSNGQSASPSGLEIPTLISGTANSASPKS